MKLGVICDGISRDLKHAVDVMDEFGLEFAELQFVGEKEVGDHDAAEIAEIDKLLRDRGKPVSCVSRHVFAGMTTANKAGDELHTKHMDALKRVIDMAHVVGSPLVRIMTNRKEQILWGSGGGGKMERRARCLGCDAAADRAGGRTGQKGKCDAGGRDRQRHHGQLKLYRPKLIDDLDAKGALKVLWDPANNCWCHERAFPDGYEEVRGGYLGHIHIKDVQVDTPRATLEVREMGTGQLADQFQPMADALRNDYYDGVISFESVHHPGNGDFEAGFRNCIGLFKQSLAEDLAPAKDARLACQICKHPGLCLTGHCEMRAAGWSQHRRNANDLQRQRRAARTIGVRHIRHPRCDREISRRNLQSVPDPVFQRHIRVSVAFVHADQRQARSQYAAASSMVDGAANRFNHHIIAVCVLRIFRAAAGRSLLDPVHGAADDNVAGDSNTGRTSWRPSRRRSAARLAGVVIVLDPTTAEFTFGHALALVGAFAAALNSIIVRRIGRDERDLVLLLFPLLGNFIVMGALMPLDYKPMLFGDLVAVAILSALGFVALNCMIGAYKTGEAAIVAPMQYSQILWATAYGALLFGEFPENRTLIGAGVIVLSGIYIVFRESRQNVSENQPVLRTRNRIAGGTYVRIGRFCGPDGTNHRSRCGDPHLFELVSAINLTGRIRSMTVARR